MAYDSNEQYRSQDGLGSGPRVYPTQINPKRFAAGSGTLEACTPVAYNTNTDKWVVWSDPVQEVTTITANATPATAGTFTLTVNGEVSATIAFDATAAAIQTALLNMAGIFPGDVVAVATTGVDLGDANAVVTLTWGGQFDGAAPVVAITTTGLTGNAHALAEATAGVAHYESDIVRGFVYPDDIELDDTDDVLGQVMMAGRIHYDDIVLPDGAVEAQLKEALRDGPRALGLIIEGLTQVR
jgi:hypothetical protein